jgi:hypothetical protein
LGAVLIFALWLNGEYYDRTIIPVPGQLVVAGGMGWLAGWRGRRELHFAWWQSACLAAAMAGLVMLAWLAYLELPELLI